MPTTMRARAVTPSRATMRATTKKRMDATRRVARAMATPTRAVRDGDEAFESTKTAAATLAAAATLVNGALAGAARADFGFATDAAPTEQVVEQQNAGGSIFAEASREAPAVTTDGLPEGNNWRYSEFIKAVMSGKVERVRFSKDGSALQLTAVNGARATVILPNDPELVDILAKNGVDISVSEGEQQGNVASLIGNLLFPLVAFGGLFFLFRRAQGGEGGGMGGMGGGPMDFGKSKSKFQEVPETGVTFADVAGVEGAKLELQEVVDFLKNPDKHTQLGAISQRVVCWSVRRVLVRLYWPRQLRVKRVCRSSPALRPSSLNCSSALAPLASETCLKKRNRRHRALSSSMRLMPSGGSVVPVWAAGTTRENKRSTSCSLKWMVSKETPASLSWPQPTDQTFWIRPCCVRDDSIVKSRSTDRTLPAESES